MNLKTIINILPFVGLLVMVLWGFLGNAWNISWIAVCVAGILMAILSIINKGMAKDKKDNMINKWVYDSVPKLLEDHSPYLYRNYQHLLKSRSVDALIPIATGQISAVQNGIEYLETDIYKASREISKMQKLTNNLLSYWNDELLDPEDKYFEAPRTKPQKLL